MQFVDRGAVGGDRPHFAVLLPEPGGLTLDQFDHDLAGVKLANARLLDQRHGFQTRPRRFDIKERQGILRADARYGKDLRFRQARLSGQGDDIDAEPEVAREKIADASLRGDKGLILTAAHRSKAGHEQQQRDRQAEAQTGRRRTIETEAAPQAFKTRAFAAQQHGRLSRRRLGQAGKSRLGLAAQPECLAQRSQDASSTIHSTRSPKLRPAWAAISGTREVSVMPGWVFTSRQTNSPSSPFESS